MPFTFAHPAVVIPFKFLPKKYYSWTGLIAGAIVPDFEAFIKFGGDKYLSHSWLGMFVFNLPVGLALAILFHAIVRDALISHLPPFFASRLSPLINTNWFASFRRRYAIVIISLLIGIATHLIWDRITHTDTYTYHQRAGITIEPHVEITIRQWLQWSNSFLGLVVIVWQIASFKAYSFSPSQWNNYWWMAATVAALIFCIRIQFYYFGDDLINSGISCSLIGVLFASFYWKLLQR